MPTGTAIEDARERLFAAAERVLRRAGPNALTSRAVTTEAGVAKGVLHHHFADFDTFLAELVELRIAELDEQAAALHACVGTGTVTGNLVRALNRLFEPLPVAIVGLVTSRHELLVRLRARTPTGIPLLTEAATMVAGYLAAERDAGRIAPGADVGALAPMLIGAGHLLLAGGEPGASDTEELRRAVGAVLAGVVREPGA
jgi:AcrR family transcriptional regulator